MNELILDNLKTHFHTREGIVRAVDGVSFSITKGEIVGLVGESGSGKSVTCHSILNLLPSPPAKIEGGTINFNKESLITASTERIQNLRGKEISMVFQDPMSSLNPYMTVLEQVAEPLIIHGMTNKNQAMEQAMDMLVRVGVKNIEDRKRAFPHEFSGGMRQRVMIAMALVTKPDLLLADEPTTALDVTVQAKILRLLKSLCQDFGTSILFVSHDLGVVAEIADRVVVMYKGKIVEENKTETLFRTPSHPYVKALIACRPTFKTKVKVLPTVDDFLGESSGKVIKKEEEVEKTINREPEELVRAEDLSVHFGQPGKQEIIRAVDQVNLSITRGNTMGLVGESGSGKSTLGRALLRLVKPTSGMIIQNGEDICLLDRESLFSFRRKMQIIFQDPYASLNPRLTIEQTLIEPLLVHQIGHSIKDRRDRVVQLLEEVGLESAHLHRYPHEFSGGQRQRVCVARALSTEPEFIVCDECVSAMDVSVQAQVLNLLRELQDKRSLTYLFISHDLSVVKFMSDEITVMCNGKIQEQGLSEEIYRNPKSSYTRELLESVPRASLTGQV